MAVSRETVCLNPWGLSQDADPGAGRPSAPGAGEPPLPAGRAAEGALKEDGQPHGAHASAPPRATKTLEAPPPLNQGLRGTGSAVEEDEPLPRE